MKRIIITIAAVFAILVVGGLVYYFTDQAKSYSVTFELASPVSSIEVYGENEVLVSTASNGQVLTLREGSYFYKPVGENVSQSSTSFDVKSENKTISVSADYTADYLSLQANDIRSNIARLLNEKYPSVMETYTLNNVVVFGDGNWGGALITPISMDSSSPENLYRVLLEKKGDSWQLSGTPRLVLTKYTNPNVAIGILTDVNNISVR